VEREREGRPRLRYRDARRSAGAGRQHPFGGTRPKDRCATLGIAFGREYIGRGYGTDAMRVIVEYGFREMGLHRIQLGVAPFNPAGIRAYEKAGFVEEGRHRESVLHDGRWYDEVLMSILDHEWAARRSPGR
jgi:RimJ/RimL family protein N-acetyltransferase